MTVTLSLTSPSNEISWWTTNVFTLSIGSHQGALSCVICETPTAPHQLPNLIADKLWSVVHELMMNELLAYTLYSRPTYKANNTQAFNILTHQLAGTMTIHQLHYINTEKWNSSIIRFSNSWNGIIEIRKDRGVGIKHVILLSMQWKELKILRFIYFYYEAYNHWIQVSHQLKFVPTNESLCVRCLLASI